MRIGHCAGAAIAALAIRSLGCGASPAGPGVVATAPRTTIAPAAPGAAAGSLKLAAWNIEWLTQRDERGKRTAASFDGLKRYAAELNPDIVALQEVDGAEAAGLVFDPGGYRFHFTHDAASVQRAGFAWKKNIDVRPNPDVNSLAIAGRRPGADVSVRWGSLELRLLSVHLKSGCQRGPLATNDEDCRILREQLPALEAWVDARAREGAAFAVLGDFNRVFDDGDEFWRDLDDADPPAADLIDAGAGGRPRCWQGRHDRFIDHIVISPPLVPWVAPHSFHELVFDPPPGNDVRLSDHCPISLTLSPPSSSPATSSAASRGARANQERITSREAQAHVGEIATVCGRVASASFLKTGKRLTFLNLDAPYPDQPFTVVIREVDRGAFDNPETRLLHKRICVTGTIETYRGKPQIAALTPDQLAEQTVD